MASKKKTPPKRKPIPQKKTAIKTVNKPIKKQAPVKNKPLPKKKVTVKNKKTSKKEYQEAIAAYKVMAGSSKGREKKKYVEAIKAYEVMVETRPNNFAKYQQLRASVVEQLREQGKELTNAEINDYTKVLYSRLKKKYENKPADFAQAISHSDELVEDFFEPEEAIVSNKNAFDWWLLHFELTKIPANSFIIIDNREHVQENTLYEGENYNSDIFVDQVYEEINEMQLNSDELLLNYLQVFISDENSNKEIVYFLLLDAGNMLIRGTSYEDILEYINGRYNIKSAFKRVKGTTPESSIKPKENKPVRKVKKSERLQKLSKLVKELKAEGLTDREINKILKAK